MTLALTAIILALLAVLLLLFAATVVHAGLQARSARRCLAGEHTYDATAGGDWACRHCQQHRSESDFEPDYGGRGLPARRVR